MLPPALAGLMSTSVFTIQAQQPSPAQPPQQPQIRQQKHKTCIFISFDISFELPLNLFEEFPAQLQALASPLPSPPSPATPAPNSVEP